MKLIGFSILSMAFSFVAFSAALAATPTYQIETLVERNGKSEKMNLVLKANDTGLLSALDPKNSNGMKIEVTAEPVDSDTVFVKYSVREVQNGQEKVIATPQAMVFLGQQASIGSFKTNEKDSLKLDINVTEKK